MEITGGRAERGLTNAEVIESAMQENWKESRALRGSPQPKV
jgi:hypothetical protein